MARARVAIMAGAAGLSALAALPTAALGQDTVVREYHSYSYESDRPDYRDDDRYDHHRRYRDEYYEERPVEYRQSTYYEERPRYERRYRDDRRYRDSCRSNGTTGAIIGGAIGALLGRGVDRYGDRTPGTILGAGGGAVIGHEIDSKRHC